MSKRRIGKSKRQRAKAFAPVVSKPNTPPRSSTTARFTSVRQSMTIFSGPLPPAEILRQYEDLLPGAADRLFTMAENQSAHRQSLEKRIVSSDILRSYLGMACALAIALVGMYVARDIVLSGHQITGALFGFGALAALVGVFLKASNDRKEVVAETRKQENSGMGKDGQ